MEGTEEVLSTKEGRDDCRQIAWGSEVLFTSSTAAESVKCFERLLVSVLYLSSTGTFSVSSAV